MTVRGVFVGLATLDVAQHVDTPPGRNEKATSTATFVSAGGPAANAAVTFAALGGSARLVTGLGTGPIADLIRDELEQNGVEVVDLAADRAPGGAPFTTPISTIWVSANGDCSVVGSDSSGNQPLAPPDLSRMHDGADVLLVDGHHSLVASRAVAGARAAGVPVVVDVGRWKPVFEDLVGPGTHAVCSEGARPPGVEGVEGLAQYLFARGASAVAVTAGAKPVRVWPEMAAAPVFVEVPQVRTSDTLGAGDAFHGAYTYALATGASALQAARSAAEVASLRVQHQGPRAWMTHLPPPSA